MSYRAHRKKTLTKTILSVATADNNKSVIDDTEHFVCVPTAKTEACGPPRNLAKAKLRTLKYSFAFAIKADYESK